MSPATRPATPPATPPATRSASSAAVRAVGTAQRLALNAVILTVVVVCAAWLLPSAFGLERYVITGGSMAGTMDKGSIAFEREVPVSRLEVGDVITYQPPPDSGITSLVTHRIVSVRTDELGRPVFRTKGDANQAVDPWEFTLTSGTQPVVDFVVPRAGHVFLALADREVRIALVGGPAALVALSAFAELVRNLRRRAVEEPVAPGFAQQAPAPVPVPA